MSDMADCAMRDLTQRVQMCIEREVAYTADTVERAHHARCQEYEREIRALRTRNAELSHELCTALASLRKRRAADDGGRAAVAVATQAPASKEQQGGDDGDDDDATAPDSPMNMLASASNEYDATVAAAAAAATAAAQAHVVDVESVKSLKHAACPVCKRKLGNLGAHLQGACGENGVREAVRGHVHQRRLLGKAARLSAHARRSAT